MAQGHKEWIPQVGERVHGWFYEAWYTATVRKVFSVEGPEPGLQAEVLWDSEYSTSELPVAWLAKLPSVSNPLPPSNAQTEASDVHRPEDSAGVRFRAAAETTPMPQSTGTTVPFAPPPGLEGCNLLDHTNSTQVTQDIGPGSLPPSVPQEGPEVEAASELAAPPPPDIATSRPVVRGPSCPEQPPVPPPNFAPMAPPTAPPSVAPEVLAAQLASRTPKKRSTGEDGFPSDQDIRNFVAKWQFQENTYTYLKGLPGPVLQAVLPGFKASADTECVDAMLNKYARRILERMSDGDVDIDAFVELWSLERPTAEFLETMPLELKQQVIWGFHPKEAKPFDQSLRRFAFSIAENLKIPLRERSNSSMSTATTKATAGGATTPMTDREVVTSIPLPKQSLQEELLSFIHKYQVKGVALQTLKALPPEQLKQIIDEFQPKNGPRDVDKALMQKINSVGKAQKEKVAPSQKLRSNEDVPKDKAKPKVSKAETKSISTPSQPTPPEVMIEKSPVSPPVMPKKPQEKWTTGVPTVGTAVATPLQMRSAQNPKAVTAVKAKAKGFALLHESTTEDEEPEENRNAKPKTRKKEVPEPKQESKSAKGKEVKPSPEPKAAVEELEKKQKKKATEGDKNSKESAAQSEANEKKMAKKERKLSEKLEKPPSKLEAPSQDIMAPMESKAPKGANKMDPTLGQHDTELNEIPPSDLWEYDKMCLSTGGDAISIPKTKMACPIDAADFLRTEKELVMGDLLEEGHFQESRIIRDKNGCMILPLDEESTACHGSEIFDDSGSEAEDMDAEVTEERRRMLRERATQRVGRTRRNQKMRLARKSCPEPSKECKDPRCENCSKSESGK